MEAKQKDRAVVIVGPTAVGKTALSFYLADRYQTELISGDAYQIYRYMNIGTAKPTLEELARYPHHLIDILEPEETFSAAQFQKMAAKKIRDLNEAGKLPVLVGGTGLYVQSLLEGYSFEQPKTEEKSRKAAETLYESLSDSERADYVRPYVQSQAITTELLHNRHRMIRLMEMIALGIAGTGIAEKKKSELQYDAAVIGLSLPREELYKRIDLRVQLMIDAGWIEETKQLLARGIDRNCQSMKAIGYRTIALYLEGQMSREEMTAQIQKETRHFAKRQLTWYKRMPYIQWFDKQSYASEKALAEAVGAYIDQKFAY